MPLDIARPRQKTTTAELHYLIRSAEKPTRYVMEPPPGAPSWNGIDDPHTVLIEDARGREPEFTLDRNGFTLIKAPTAVRNFHDSANDGRAKLSFHTSFENPLAPADAPPRESIEVRTLVFFPPNV